MEKEIKHRLNDEFEDILHFLDEEYIMKMQKRDMNVHIHNVITDLDRECFGVYLMDDKEDNLDFQLFYITKSDRLNGYSLDIKLRNRNRDSLVGLFCFFLAKEYNNLDPINAFNLYQSKLRGILEMCGYFTYSNIDLDNGDMPVKVSYEGKKISVLSDSKKGNIAFHLIKKLDMYRWVFDRKSSLEIIEGKNYVYLLLNTRNNSIKIGRSIDPKFREKTLQSDEPDIQPIVYWEAPKSVENQLHKLFSSKRLRGEWFNLDFNDLKEIKAFMQEYN